MPLFFSTGIHQSFGVLATMQLPGFYWINADCQAYAEQFCAQIIQALSPDAHAVLIYEHTSSPFITHITNIPVKNIPLFTIPSDPSAIMYLTNDLDRALKNMPRLCILFVNTQIFGSLTKKNLDYCIQTIRTWVNKEHSTLLVLNYGKDTHPLQNRLVMHHLFLDGLARLHGEENVLQYTVSWWAGETGFTGNQTLVMNADDHSWTFKPDMRHDAMLSQQDADMYIANQRVLEGASAPTNHWRLFEDNASLIQQAKRSQAATIIFALSDTSHMHELAQQIHFLRYHCGDALKIVVRELSNTIRHSDERLLLGCGANLTVPHNMALPKFLTLLESIQGQRMTRHIPKNIETLFQALNPIEQKGYLPVKEFSETVTQRLTSTVLPENHKGLLVALIPEINVSAKQALALCHLKRFGDIATVAHNQLFLFLSTCAPSDLDTALNFIFKQPVSQIFSKHIAWNLDIHIISQIEHIQASAPTEDDALLPADTVPEESAHSVTVARRVPKPITLSISKRV